MIRARPFVLAALLVSSLTGCTVLSGDALEEAAVDRSLTTASIVRVDPAVSADTLSDSRLVRNAVSAANIGAVDAEPLAWTNADTGTSGTITAIREVRAGDQICRSFTTSRQRFDGVALFAGEACTQGKGEWTLTRFSEGG